MYSFIATDRTAPYIREALGEKSIFEEIGVFDSEGIRTVFKRVLRSIGDVLIVDLDVGPGEDIIAGIRDIKIQIPSIRVIILGIGVKPGNLTISRLISLGIYDFITLENNDENIINLPALLKDKLNNTPSSYADVARWHIIEGINNMDLDKKVIFKDKLVGTIYIAVGGSTHGTGTTNTAIAIGSFLGKYKKFKTAVIEVRNDKDNNMCFFTLSEVYKVKQILHSNAFNIAGIDFYSGKLKDLLLTGKKYDYVVMDLGPLKLISKNELLASSNIEEMGRADLSFLTTGNSIFRLRKDLTFFENYLDDWKVLFLPGEDSDTEEFKKYLLGDNSYYNLPVINNPLYLSDEAKEFFKKILAQVLPQQDEETKKKRFLLWK